MNSTGGWRAHRGAGRRECRTRWIHALRADDHDLRDPSGNARAAAGRSRSRFRADQCFGGNPDGRGRRGIGAGIGSIQDLIALAKSKPGEVFYAANNRGSLPHLTGEMLAHRTGTRFNFVPYPGAAAGLQDVLGGRVPMIVESVGALSGVIQAGSVKPLAVTSPRAATRMRRAARGSWMRASPRTWGEARVSEWVRIRKLGPTDRWAPKRRAAGGTVRRRWFLQLLRGSFGRP